MSSRSEATWSTAAPKPVLSAWALAGAIAALVMMALPVAAFFVSLRFFPTVFWFAFMMPGIAAAAGLILDLTLPLSLAAFFTAAIALGIRQERPRRIAIATLLLSLAPVVFRLMIHS